ncbi:hypothetical protein KSP39_PZI014381 [Platanthera zijinensis]|uniref:Uncharacterized protein n=1 Tax=Platanthera zijinensis TaxID=2320716 RepID=A0AAP0G2H5_9ASPA
MLNMQHVEKKRTFGQNSIQVSQKFKGTLYSELLGRVLLNTLKLIKVEKDNYHKTKNVRINCPHTTRSTLELPCAHELTPYVSENNACPVWLIHKYWKQLSFSLENVEISQTQESVNMGDIDISFELKGIIKRYKNTNEYQQKEIRNKLRQLKDDYTNTKHSTSLFEIVVSEG